MTLINIFRMCCPGQIVVVFPSMTQEKYLELYLCLRSIQMKLHNKYKITTVLFW